MLYTNGFSENVFDSQWHECINSFLDVETGIPTSLSAMADCQVRRASENSKVKDSTPYSEKQSIPSRSYGFNDDISVTIALYTDRKGFKEWNEDLELFDGSKFQYFDMVVDEHNWDPVARASEIAAKKNAGEEQNKSEL